MARKAPKPASSEAPSPHKDSLTPKKRKRDPVPEAVRPVVDDDSEDESEEVSSSDDEESEASTNEEEEEQAEVKSPPKGKGKAKGKGDAPQKKTQVASDDDGEQDDEDEAMQDEPTLSHAEKRRQRKREQKLQKLTQHQEGPQRDDIKRPSKKQKLQDGSAKVVAPTAEGGRQNSVWVGNLSYKTTVDDLKKFFGECGEITRVNMPMRIPNTPGANGFGQMKKGENRGFAYVDFATPDGKIAAIALSEQPLTGRKLLIKDGDDFTGRPVPEGTAPTTSSQTHSKTAQKILKVQKQPPAPTLFLGNLGFETTEADIKMLFEAHKHPRPQKSEGEAKSAGNGKEASDEWIRKIRMGTFEDSGACKGFAFVDFVSTEAATSVLINPKNHRLNGRQLVVEYASIDAVKRGASKHLVADGSAPQKGKKRGGDNGLGRGDVEGVKPKKDSAYDKEDTKDDGGRVNKAPNDDNQETEPKVVEKRKVGGGPRISGGQRGPKHRPKPGAALATAKRESVAIMPSQGKKIKFGE